MLSFSHTNLTGPLQDKSELEYAVTVLLNSLHSGGRVVVVAVAVDVVVDTVSVTVVVFVEVVVVQSS